MEVILSREQVRLIDRLAIERFGISGLILMENAGQNASVIIDQGYGPRGKAAIVCGPGNNGGDGCVIARHLHNRGWGVRLLMTGMEGAMTPDTLTNFRIVAAMALEPIVAPEFTDQQNWVRSIQVDEVIVDALLGTGFHGQVRSPLAELIEALNRANRRAMVGIDVPSGLDCDTGTPSNATMRVDRTITFVALKRGYAQPSARPYLGQLIVVDIGAPAELIREVANAPSGSNGAIPDSNL